MRAKAKFLKVSDATTGMIILFDTDDGTKGYTLYTAFVRDFDICLAKELMETRVKRAAAELAHKESLDKELKKASLKLALEYIASIDSLPEKRKE